jgi:hypothetical protein
VCDDFVGRDALRRGIFQGPFLRSRGGSKEGAYSEDGKRQKNAGRPVHEPILSNN